MAEPVSNSIPEGADAKLVPDESQRELEQIENQFLAGLARGEAPLPEAFAAANPHLADQLRSRLEEDLALHELNRAVPCEEDAEPLQTRLPERIDRYVVEEKLGEGGASVVLRGFDPVLEREVAIKLLRQVLPAGSDFSERFAREARVVAALRHPHIVPVFDCGEFAGRPFLVMGLVTGNTLDDELTRSGAQPLDFRRTADMIRKIAEALHYAHERGIIHRDVKPGNILVDERGEPQLADFGLAMQDAAGSERTARRSTRRSTDCQSVRKETHASGEASVGESGQTVEGDVQANSPHHDGNLEPSLTLTHQLLGTPAYMSPEQAAGRAGEADGRSDLFSLGIVLYRMLTGRRPFVGSDTELRDRIQHATPVRLRAINPRIPRDLETICLKAMEKRPADRYETAQQMADELRRWLEDQPLVINPPSLGRRMARWLVRNRGLATVSGLALVLAIVAIHSGIDSQLRRRESHIASGARAETNLRNLIAEGREQLRGSDQGRTARVRTEILPRIAEHRGRLLPNAPLEEIDCEVRSLFAASLAEFDLKLLQKVDLPIALNLAWPATLQPSGAYAVIGSADRPVRIDLHGDGPTVTGIENREPRSRVAFSPDGRWFAFSPASHGVELWDGAVQECVARSDANVRLTVVTMAFDSQGEKLLICDHRGRSTCFAVPALSENSPVVPPLEEMTTEVTAAAFRHDLSQVAFGDTAGDIFFDDLVTGTRQEFATIPSAVVCLAWSPDGGTIAAGGRDGVVQVFETKSGARIHRLALGTNAVRGLCFTPDGSRLAAGCHGHPGCIWSVETGHVELKLTTIPCTMTSDGARLLGTSQQRLEIYDLVDQGPIRRLPGHQAAIDQLRWSARGRALVTIDNRFVVRVWDPSGKEAPSQFALPDPEWYPSDVGLAVSDDGATVVTAHRTGGHSELRILDRSGQCRQLWILPPGYDRLVLQEDGAVQSVRQEACEFDRGPCRTVVREFRFGQDPIERGVLRESEPDEQGFFSHRLTPNGRYYVWTGPRLPREKSQTEVWDLADLTALMRLPLPGPSHWGDPDAVLAGPDLTLWTTNGNSFKRYALGLGKGLRAVPMPSFPLAVSADGRWSIMSQQLRETRSEIIVAFDAPPSDRSWLRLANRDQSGTSTIRFSPDVRYVAWGSQSGEITLVDLPLLKQKVEEFERSYGGE